MTSHTTSPSSDGSASKFSSGSGSGGGSAGFLDGLTLVVEFSVDFLEMVPYLFLAAFSVEHLQRSAVLLAVAKVQVFQQQARLQLLSPI